MKKPVETFFFYRITDPKAYKLALRTKVASLVTSTATLVGPADSQPLAYLNMAYSQRGLLALGIKDNLGDSFFAQGQLADATKLGDTLTDWEQPWTSANSAVNGIHGVLLVASDAQGPVDDLLQTVMEAFGSSIVMVTRLDAAARPGSQAGREREFSSIPFFILFYFIFIFDPFVRLSLLRGHDLQVQQPCCLNTMAAGFFSAPCFDFLVC